MQSDAAERVAGRISEVASVLPPNLPTHLPTIFYTLAPRVLRRHRALLGLLMATRFGMLSVGRVADSRAVYFFEEIVLGGDDSYYTQAGEAPGEWVGAGSAKLGLQGSVEQEQVAAILAGHTPDGLSKLRATTVSRPGYDLTFSAPKSVSLSWALGDPDQTERIAAAHRAAVLESVRYLEANAACVRRGHAGAEVVPADGFVAGAFQHRTNRSLDPQLHTHVVVANMAEGPDGRWTALDGRRIYEHSRTSGAIYQARLKYELANDPGLMFDPKPNGTFEVVGVSEAQRRQFSKRRQQIESELAELGLVTPRSAQVATLTTRPDKASASTDEQLRQRWELEATLVDLDVTDLPTYRRTPSISVNHADVAATLTESDASFKRQHVIRTIADASTEGATLDQLESAADQYLASTHAVDLGHGWWSTPTEVQLEHRATELAAIQRPAPAAQPELVAEAVTARPSLTPEQASLISGVTQSDAPVDVVVGWAGTGKTFSLDAVRQAHEASGHTVIGAALSARAAAELEGGSGIASTTADRLLLDLSSGQRRLNGSTVLVIDEAGMLGNRRLAAFIDEAAQTNAKLILVGDPKQLPEIDPGGLFKSLADRLGHHELTENRRQLDPVERQAVTDVRLGNAPAAVDRLADHGHIITAANADHLRQRMVTDWYQAYANGNTVLISASRRSAVADLNQRARQTLAEHGHLGPTVLSHNEADYAIGDQVMTLRNNRRIGLANGELGTVEGPGDAGGLRMRLRNGRSKEIPADYIDAGHLTHGYASTIHKAQGATVDQSFILADDSLSQESGYTALTRGRASNRVYLVRPEIGEHDRSVDDPLSLLKHSLSRSAAKTAAIDRLGPAPTIGI